MPTTETTTTAIGNVIPGRTCRLCDETGVIRLKLGAWHPQCGDSYRIDWVETETETTDTTTSDPVPYNVAAGFVDTGADGTEHHRYTAADVDAMRATAADWHGGQGSALYAFASTGTVVDGFGGELVVACREATHWGETTEASKLTRLFAAVPSEADDCGGWPVADTTAADDDISMSRADWVACE